LTDQPILLDVSRLIWRRWTGRLPTGIDRVCLAYLDHFGSRAHAVVQFRGFRRILSRNYSARLFRLLLGRGGFFKLRLVAILAKAALHRNHGADGQIYLNVGHTGLNSPHLQPWLAKHRLRPVYLVHDLIPLTHPQYCRRGEDVRHRERMANALNSAHGIIANSQDTASELASFAQREALPMPPHTVAWLGIEEIGQVERQLATGPYFVIVGTIEARKNHLLILDAWAELVARLGQGAPELIIIGQRGWEAEAAIDRLDNLGPLAGKVRELGRCNDAELQGWIAGARALLMPSFVEGFGLPLMEALELGTPVIASDLEVFREIARDVPRYLDPTDNQGWAEAILSLASDGPERQRQKAQLSSFNPPRWSDHFEAVERFLASV
jgi:glycosyltransferase involved in cell wall biosynthesis